MQTRHVLDEERDRERHRGRELPGALGKRDRAQQKEDRQAVELQVTARDEDRDGVGEEEKRREGGARLRASPRIAPPREDEHEERRRDVGEQKEGAVDEDRARSEGSGRGLGGDADEGPERRVVVTGGVGVRIPARAGDPGDEGVGLRVVVAVEAREKPEANAERREESRGEQARSQPTPSRAQFRQRMLPENSQPRAGPQSPAPARSEATSNRRTSARASYGAPSLACTAASTE